MSELFNESVDQTQTTESKYASWDLDQLKRKAEAADEHIKRLEAEAAARREQENTTATLEEILEKLDQVNRPSSNYMPSTGVNPTSTERSNSSQSINKQEIEAMVAETLTKTQKETLAKQNVSTVRNKLEEVWGPTYSKKLSERANEIGVTQDFLSSMAEGYPQAFLKLVLEDTKPGNPNVHLAPQTSVRSVTTTQQPMTTWKEFSAAQKVNPALRHDANFQKQLAETAERLGNSFFNS